MIYSLDVLKGSIHKSEDVRPACDVKDRLLETACISVNEQIIR